MTPQHERAPALRQFLVINFRVGSCESGYLVGPALVSTPDYRRFHLWDEPDAAVLGEDDYEIVKVYRLGLNYDEVTRQFAKEFPHAVTGRNRAAGWITADGTFFSVEGWADIGQHPILAA
jgi:hypothetical protein